MPMMYIDKPTLIKVLEKDSQLKYLAEELRSWSRHYIDYYDLREYCEGKGHVEKLERLYKKIRKERD